MFRPDLCNRPVVVLSNNDGCAIARSNEAKALGIRMGAPWFQIRHLEDQAGLVALSANFALYGDMSDRMMSLVAGLGHQQEIYSIDESFVDLTGIRGDMIRRSKLIRQRVLQWTGIPTCVGIGSTKTLAKLANHIAKTVERKPGIYPESFAAHGSISQVCHLGVLSERDRYTLFERTDVTEVWGVGPRIGRQLKDVGIHTVFDLIRLDPATVARRWSLVLERTVRELQGMPCIDLDHAPAPKKQIACTRSFCTPVLALHELTQAVTEFTSRAAQKLRRQNHKAGQVLTFIRTSPFRRQDDQYSRSVVSPLVRPSSDTALLVHAAISNLKAMYVPGYRYAKAGVMLMDLVPEGLEQGELDWGDGAFETGSGSRHAVGAFHASSQAHNTNPLASVQNAATPRDRSRVMTAMDVINERYGRGTLKVASAGTDHCGSGKLQGWRMKQERRTPGYTTCWEELAMVKG